MKFIQLKNFKVMQNRMTNKKLEIKIKKDRRFKDLIYNLDSKKIRKEFNWNEKYSLVEGIDKTIEWITNNLNYINKQNKTMFTKNKYKVLVTVGCGYTGSIISENLANKATRL